MDNIEDIRVTVYNELNKIRDMEIYFLHQKLSQYIKKINIVDIEELVNLSIMKAAFNFDKNNIATFKTYYKAILKNATINYIRDKSKYKFISIETVFEGFEGNEKIEAEIEKSTSDPTFDKIVDSEKEQTIENLRKDIIEFLEELDGDEKIVADELVKLMYQNEKLNYTKIAEIIKMDYKRFIRIKNNIVNGLIEHIKKLPKDLRDLYRKLTYEPTPKQKTKFAYLLESRQVTFNKNIEDISSFDKIISLIFAYQESKFVNFINDNISDNKIRKMYDQLK